MIQRCTSDGLKIHTNFSNYKSNQVSISGKTFSTKAIIFHEGKTIRSGHYTVYLKNENGWTHCNDNVLSFKSRLPYKLQNSYLFFLELKMSK